MWWPRARATLAAMLCEAGVEATGLTETGAGRRRMTGDCVTMSRGTEARWQAAEAEARAPQGWARAHRQ